jgi:hypothetical protein
VNEHLKKAKELLEGYEKFGISHNNKMTAATAHAVIAVAELLEAAGKPIEVKVNPRVVVSVPKPVDPRDREFVPGDMVGATIRGEYFKDFNGRHGVVAYGPDHSGGWQVAFADRMLRCVAEELTMITRREDRTQETDKVAYKWKERK